MPVSPTSASTISVTPVPRSYLSKGVHPKFVQELVDYATIAITLDRYSHGIPAMGDQIKKAFEDVLS